MESPRWGRDSLARMGNVSKKLTKRFTYRQTTPEGAEIPIPKRKDVLADLRKAARPSGPADPRPKSNGKDPLS
jgi:hypothetical protein